VADRVIERQVIEVGIRGGRETERQWRAIAKAEREARDRLAALRLEERKAGEEGKKQQAALRAQRVEVDRLSRSRRDAAEALQVERRAQREAEAAARAGVQAARAEAVAAREAAKAELERARALEKVASLNDKIDRQRARERMNNRSLQDIGARIQARQAEIERLDRVLALGAGGGFRGMLSRAAPVAAEGVRRVGRFALGAGGALAAGALGGTVAFGRSVVERGGEFVRQRDALEALLGSRSAADRRLSEIRGINGVGLGEGLQVANRLGNLGLSTSAGSVKSVAAIAAATPGKSAMDFAEALADSVTGENERLKEFGIKAKVDGDKVRYTIRGVTTEVENNAKAIQQFFEQVASGPLFSHALERKAQGLQGAIGSLGDRWTLFAAEVYETGLGDALRDIVNEITAMITTASGPGAKSIGKTLGNALKEIWARLKDLIGPASELPAKVERIVSALASGIQTVLGFAGAIGKLIDTVGLGPIAFAGLAAAAFSLAGPLGAAAAAGVALGAGLSSVIGYAREAAREILGVGSAVENFKRKQDELYEETQQRIRTAQANANAEAVNERNRQADIASEGASAAEKRVIAAGLRERGVTSLAALPEAEREALLRKAGMVRIRARGAAGYGGEQAAGLESARAGDVLAGAAERRADDAELRRLRDKAKSKGVKMTSAEKKRLKELSDRYGLAVETDRTPGAAKEEHSAFGAEVEAEIKQRAQEAGKVAGLRAVQDKLGAKEADKIALRTEKETAARLRAQVADGKFLPGQVNAGLLAVAQVDEVAGRGTPPVISVVNAPVTVQGINVTVDRPQVTTGAEELGQTVAREVRRELVTQTRDALRGALRRVAV